MNANLYALLEANFPRDRSRPCMIVPDGTAVSYQDLVTLSARIGNALIDAGAKPGDRIAVQVDKHWQVVPLYLGCLRAGLVYLPLNTGYQRSELTHFFTDAEPRIIICRPESEAVVLSIAAGATVLTLGADGGSLMTRARAMPATLPTAMLAPDDLAAIVYTSGTTGRSKGAAISHRNLATNALTLVDIWEITSRDTLIHALPVYHVHGLFVALHTTLLTGARILWQPRFDAKEVAALMPQATLLMGVPTFYARLLAEPTFTRESCRTMRLFVSGSAPLLAETFVEFQQRTGHPILERYGMTETGMNTSNPLRATRRAGTVGTPLPHVEIRIVDPRGRRCAVGKVGAIEVRGPNVFSGYWRMPTATRDSFTTDGFFRTGDLGAWTRERYIQIVGRAKDLIISGGLNIYPKEIEERIDAMAGVSESAVIGVPDPDFGEAVTAVVVRKNGHALTEPGLIGALKAEIANFKVPKRIFFVDELPRNAMGKVLKHRLRETYAARGAD